MTPRKKSRPTRLERPQLGSQVHPLSLPYEREENEISNWGCAEESRIADAALGRIKLRMSASGHTERMRPLHTCSVASSPAD